MSNETTLPQVVYCYGCCDDVPKVGKFCAECGTPFDFDMHSAKQVMLTVGDYDPELALMQFLRMVQESSDSTNQRSYIENGSFGSLTRPAWQRIAAWVQKLADEMKEPGPESNGYYQSDERKRVSAFVSTLPIEHQNVFKLLMESRA